MKIVREADGGSCDLRRSELNSGGWVFTSAEVLLVPKKLFNCKWSTKNEKKIWILEVWSIFENLDLFFLFLLFLFCFYLFIFCFYLFLFCFYLFVFVFIVFICFYLFLFCCYLFLFVFFFFPEICSGRGRRLFAHVLGNINSLVPWKASQEVES